MLLFILNWLYTHKVTWESIVWKCSWCACSNSYPTLENVSFPREKNSRAKAWWHWFVIPSLWESRQEVHKFNSSLDSWVTYETVSKQEIKYICKNWGCSLVKRAWIQPTVGITFKEHKEVKINLFRWNPRSHKLITMVIMLLILFSLTKIYSYFSYTNGLILLVLLIVHCCCLLWGKR